MNELVNTGHLLDLVSIPADRWLVTRSSCTARRGASLTWEFLTMKLTFTSLFFLLLICRQGLSQDKPALREVDRIRLAEAFRLADSVGNRVWKDWSRAPFAVLLVTPDHEILVRHPKPSPDFVRLGHDPLLKSDVYYRKRTQPISFLATFPAISGSMISTIVVGEAENTWVKTSTLW